MEIKQLPDTTEGCHKLIGELTAVITGLENLLADKTLSSLAFYAVF